MYGLYGLKHHKVEMLPCGTDGRRRTREDKATQPLDAGRLSFAKRTKLLRIESILPSPPPYSGNVPSHCFKSVDYHRVHTASLCDVDDGEGDGGEMGQDPHLQQEISSCW